jgi:hypothetical protein
MVRKNYVRWLPIFTIGFLAALRAFSQGEIIRGTVVDSLTQEPLAFANLALSDRRTGTTTDIDGRFQLVLPRGYADKVSISYVGYHPRQITIDALRASRKIQLAPSVRQLGEVTIVAGANPALRIIRNATAAKNNHRTDRLNSYSYKSYTKVVFKLEGESVSADSLRKRNKKNELTPENKSLLTLDSIRQKQHLLVTESVAEKFFLRPNKQIERLLDYKISGFQTPLLASLPNDYQPLGFQDDWIKVLGKDHISPLTRNSDKIYDFTLTDTTFFEGDSVFVIAFTPLGNAGVNQLSGQLSICADGWAIKNVIARSADPFAKIDFRIQQNYGRFDGRWFPIQLNTDLYFKENRVGPMFFVTVARSYLQDIRINPAIDKSIFGDAQVELGGARDTTQLARYRAEARDSLESRTFVWFDSVAQKIGVLRAFDRVMEGFFANVYPTGKIDWQLNRVIRFNRFEGVRAGLGLRTNQRFSRFFSLGGYAGYGFRDKQWKWGGDLILNLSQKKDWTLQFAYQRDLQEPGVSQFFEGYRSLSSYSFRQLVADRFDHAELFRVRTSWKPATSWRVRAGLERTELTPQFTYAFRHDNELLSSFAITEAGGEVTYIHRLREVRLAGRKAAVQFEQPIFSFSVARGISGLWDSQFSYTRYDAFYSNHWKHRRWGTSQLTLVGGYLAGVAPLQKQFFGPASRETGIWVTHTFQTMGIYEFLSDQYGAVFWKHNFGWLYQTKYSKPELLLWQGAGWGRFNNTSNREGHQFITVQDFQRGYFESGLGANNLLRFNYADVAFLGLGGGIFYRWGDYALPRTRENVLFRLNMTFSF